jgi:hypothetical protein
MGDDAKADERFNYIKDRISAAFPKLAGPKFEKSMQEEAIKYVTTPTLRGRARSCRQRFTRRGEF